MASFCNVDISRVQTALGQIAPRDAGNNMETKLKYCNPHICCVDERLRLGQYIEKSNHVYCTDFFTEQRLVITFWCRPWTQSPKLQRAHNDGFLCLFFKASPVNGDLERSPWLHPNQSNPSCHKPLRQCQDPSFIEPDVAM